MHFKMKTRKILFFSLIAFFLMGASCKKAVEQQYDDILKKLMTDGTWIITKFTENGTDITPSFNAWICKFNDDNTVTATQGVTVKTGTWQSNITAQTIFAQFPSSVGDPVQKLNGTWSITSTSATVGKFAQTKGAIPYTMELTKQ
jgi:hypothetical protein